MSLFLCVLALLAVLSAVSASIYTVKPAELPSAPYPRWAHYQWVWYHNSHTNSADISELVQGYRDHKIPFGAVNIDSTWETAYNNFEVDKNKFPDFSGFIKGLKDSGLKVTMWITSMVNTDNPDYQMCVDKGYLVRDSKGVVRPMQWWKGSGGLLDYSNPEALQWWHSQMDKVLDVGIDGFKTDGTDPYIGEYILAGGALGYNNVSLTYKDYANYYYRDFYNYANQKRQGNGLIMARPVDCMLDRASKMCWGYAPKDTMFSGWVGDDDATFEGFRGAMRKVIYSAWRGYANMGCDIGGYRDQGEPNKDLFLRWAQFGAFIPLMENGGGGEHRPWMYDQETLEIYRKFSVEHERISPYLHTVGANAADKGVSSLNPLAPAPEELSSLSFDYNGQLPYFTQPSTYSYRIGEDILVHPVAYEAAKNQFNMSTSLSVVEMIFPELSSGKWLDWWAPHDDSKAYMGGEKKRTLVPLWHLPVYVRQNAFLPLQMGADREAVSFTWFKPRSGDKATATMREKCEGGVSACGWTAEGSYSDSAIDVSISAYNSRVGVEVVGVGKPQSFTFSPDSAKCEQVYLSEREAVHVACLSAARGVKIQLNF